MSNVHELDVLKLLRGIGWVPPYLKAEYKDITGQPTNTVALIAAATSLYQRIDAAQAQDYHVRATRMVGDLDRLARDLEEMREKHPASPMDWRHMATRVERFRNQLNSTINDGRERRGTCRSCGAKDVALWKEYDVRMCAQCNDTIAKRLEEYENETRDRDSE